MKKTLLLVAVAVVAALCLAPARAAKPACRPILQDPTAILYCLRP